MCKLVSPIVFLESGLCVRQRCYLDRALHILQGRRSFPPLQSMCDEKRPKCVECCDTGERVMSREGMFRSQLPFTLALVNRISLFKKTKDGATKYLATLIQTSDISKQ